MHTNIPLVFWIWQYSSINTVHVNNMSRLDIPNSVFFQKCAFSARAIKRLWEHSWSKWMVHSGNCGFLALTELFQKQLSPTRPTRIQNLNVVRDSNNGGFASNATPQNEQLEEDDCATVGGGRTMGAAWQASFAEGQEWWRQRILIYISIEVTPSEYCVHVNMWRVCVSVIIPWH